ncbi:YjbF family lipoprotein [Pseudoroseicyclus sp. H15]
MCDRPLKGNDVSVPSGGTPSIAPPYRGLAADQAGTPKVFVTVEEAGYTGVMALVQSRDGYQTFMSSDDISITLKDNMVVATRGFGDDLASSDASETARLVASGRTGQVERFHGFYSGSEDVELRAYVCDIASAGTISLEGPAGPVAVRHMTETCRNPEQGFVNHYYYSPAGALLASTQWAGDSIGPLTVEPG